LLNDVHNKLKIAMKSEEMQKGVAGISRTSRSSMHRNSDFIAMIAGGVVSFFLRGRLLMSSITKFLVTGAIVSMLAASVLMPAEAASKRQPVSLTCTVDILHEFRAQDGTLLSTETYQQTFVLAQGANFTDDYSTPTRFKEFSATLTQVGSDSMVSINWFADVSTFNSVDLDTAVVIPDKQKQGTAAGRHRFSSSPGHDTTTYTLTAVRN
jgi:hypothetical protein